MNRLRSFRRHIQNLGLPAALVYDFHHIRCHLPHVKHPFRLYSKYSRHALLCRPHTSDLTVFWQIFTLREYSFLDDIADASLILDCGANVGYSSAYFLSRYPNARVIAVEPDLGNFSLMVQNLSRYQERVRMINAAVWSHPTELSFLQEFSGPGKEWGRRLHECVQRDVPRVEATDIATLLGQSGFHRISILKIDVEGAEETIFSANCDSWLDKVDNIVIELHGRKGETTFMKAVSNAGFTCVRSGELTVCRKKPA